MSIPNLFKEKSTPLNIELINEILTNRGWDEKQLAIAMTKERYHIITVNVIQKWLSGENMPNALNFLALARVLGVEPPDDLLIKEPEEE